MEASAPEAALQPKKTYSAGDKQLMEAEYTEDIGHLFGEKVCRPIASPSPLLFPPPHRASGTKKSWISRFAGF